MAPKKLSKKAKGKLEAKAHIQELFKEAESVGLVIAKRYMKKAKKLALKHRVTIPISLKRRFCKHCFSYFKLGKNCRVRVTGKHVVYYCLDCKKHMRFPYKKRS